MADMLLSIEPLTSSRGLSPTSSDDDDPSKNCDVITDDDIRFYRNVMVMLQTLQELRLEDTLTALTIETGIELPSRHQSSSRIQSIIHSEDSIDGTDQKNQEPPFLPVSSILSSALDRYFEYLGLNNHLGRNNNVTSDLASHTPEQEQLQQLYETRAPPFQHVPSFSLPPIFHPSNILVAKSIPHAWIYHTSNTNSRTRSNLNSESDSDLTGALTIVTGSANKELLVMRIQPPPSVNKLPLEKLSTTLLPSASSVQVLIRSKFPSPILSIDFHPSREGLAVVGCMDGSIHSVRGLPSESVMQKFQQVHRKFITSVNHSPDGRWLLSGSKDASVMVRRWRDFELFHIVLNDFE